MSEVCVVGSGPNGLAAAVVMARAGLEVTVIEAQETLGGGARTEEILGEGILSDVCSAVHPMLLASPFFREFEIQSRVELITPRISFGHPLDGGSVALAYRDVAQTSALLSAGKTKYDGAYQKIFEPLLKQHMPLMEYLLGSPWALPKLARGSSKVYGALLHFAREAFSLSRPTGNSALSAEAQALFSGLAAHNISAQPSLTSSAAGLMLGLLAHAQGWPIPVGGSQSVVRALVEDLVAHGGTVVKGQEISDLREVQARAIFVDTSAQSAARLGKNIFQHRYMRALENFRGGNGIFKMDLLLDGPIPWAARELADAGTVHVGGSAAEVYASENLVAQGKHPERPFTLLAQPSRFDSTRAAGNQHVVWAYAHVPRDSTVDMSERMLRQIERFAPGMRERILRLETQNTSQVRAHNANYAGGDIMAGAMDLRQVLARPVLSAHPWRVPTESHFPGRVYLCSASTAPGPGVHAMAGYHAAGLALKEQYGVPLPPLGVDS